MARWKKKWTPGDKARLARTAGISPQYLSDLLAGRRQCHPTLAGRLEKASAEIGYNIPRAIWAFHDLRKDNPLFPLAQ